MALTIEELKVLIQNDEHRQLELKKTTGELKDGMHSACAFLNTEGGWLIIGISPKSLKILGQRVTDDTQQEIAQALSLLEPQVDVRVEYIDIPDRPGVRRIVEACQKRGVEAPTWTVDGGFVVVTFKRPTEGELNQAQVGGQKTTKWPEKWPEIADNIIGEIQNDSTITIAKLEALLELGHTTVKKILREMQNENIIRRVGPDKGGYWEIINQ